MQLFLKTSVVPLIVKRIKWHIFGAVGSAVVII